MKRTFIGIQKHLANDRCEFVHMSDEFLNLIGYTKQEIKDKFDNSLCSLMVEEDSAKVIKELHQQLSSDTLFTINFRIIKKSGEIIWLHAQGCIVKEEEMYYFYSEIADATDYYNLNSYYKRILHNLPTPIFFMDDSKKIIYLNPAATELFGCSLEQCIGRHCTVLQGMSCDMNPCFIENFYQGQSIVQLENFKGKSYRVHITFLPKLHENQSAGYVCAFSEPSEYTDSKAIVQQAKQLICR